MNQSTGKELPGSVPLKSVKEEATAQAWVTNNQDGAKAVIAGGYSESGAANTFYVLKQKRRFTERLAFLTGLKLRQHDLSIDDFVRTIKEQLYFDVSKLTNKAGNLIPINELAPEIARCVVGVDFAYKKTTYPKETCECGREHKTVVETSVMKYRTEGKSRYNEQLGKYLQVLKDMDEVGSLDTLLKKATTEGEELLIMAIGNKKKEKIYDHSQEIQKLVDGES